MRLIHGAGFNDADYVVNPTVDGKPVVCPVYRTWLSMLKRCYCPKSKLKQPTYAGCQVCEEWKRFSNFKRWMEKQDWQGKQLDKDFLGGGKLYAPKTCVFIPQWLNSLFLDCGARRGEWPQGVSWHKQRGKFRVDLAINGKRKYLASFTCPQEASQAYIKAKTEYVRSKYEHINDPRLVTACERRLALLGEPQCQAADRS